MSKSKREDVLSDLASRLLSAMLDDIVMDITLQTHQELARNRAICDVCHTRCGLVHLPGPSAPGTSVKIEGEQNGGTQLGASTSSNGGTKGDGNVYFECLNCNREIAWNRYAPHLSSCMGIGARKGANRSANGKSKDNGRSASPSVFSETGDVSDDSKPLKSKAKSKAKQADDAEFNLNKKRPASPATSPSKKKKTANGASPLSRAGTEPDLNGTFKVPPSKLRESSTFSSLDKSTVRSRSSSIDSQASASTRTSSVISGRSAPFPLASPLKSGGPRASFQRPPSPPRMPPPARVPEPDFMIDVEGDETGSSTDTDDSS
ncbi:hypothetical protein OE88DRAFT_1803995 [Heliocybe sulcata]|uniref:SAGA-associated factor 11 n=1 Tax=Heliocybe sulcata TaxID=5364 RepID=A0A5C3NJ80_9AGAM|nr:hypothetical protein OE88DRAFT_1803995 [Heliocybe sulcata]